MAKPNFEACEVYLKFLGVFLGNTIFTCLGTRIQFFDIATTRSFFKLYLGRNSLYSTTGVHMGVGNWKLFDWKNGNGAENNITFLSETSCHCWRKLAVVYDQKARCKNDPLKLNFSLPELA